MLPLRSHAEVHEGHLCVIPADYSDAKKINSVIPIETVLEVVTPPGCIRLAVVDACAHTSDTSTSTSRDGGNPRFYKAVMEAWFGPGGTLKF